MTRRRRKQDPGSDTALGEMDPSAFIKVLMLTAFLDGGDFIAHEHTETTLTKCEQAKEEATRFNNRFLWPWETHLRNDRRVFVACFWHPETEEA